MAICKCCGKQVSWWDLNLKEKICSLCIENRIDRIVAEKSNSLGASHVRTYAVENDVIFCDLSHCTNFYGDLFITNKGIILFFFAKWNASNKMKITRFTANDLLRIRQLLYGSSIHERIKFYEQYKENSGSVILLKSEIQSIKQKNKTTNKVEIMITICQDDDTIFEYKIVFNNTLWNISNYLADWLLNKEIHNYDDQGANNDLSPKILISELSECNTTKANFLEDSISSLATSEPYFKLFIKLLENHNRDIRENVYCNMAKISPELVNKLIRKLSLKLDEYKEPLYSKIVPLIPFGIGVALLFSTSDILSIFFFALAIWFSYYRLINFNKYLFLRKIIARLSRHK